MVDSLIQPRKYSDFLPCLVIGDWNSFHSLPTQLKFPLSHSPSLTPIIETFPLKLSSTCKTLLLLPFLPYLLLAIRVSLKNGKGSFSLSICRQCVSLVVHSLTLKALSLLPWYPFKNISAHLPQMCFCTSSYPIPIPVFLHGRKYTSFPPEFLWNNLFWDWRSRKPQILCKYNAMSMFDVCVLIYLHILPHKIFMKKKVTSIFQSCSLITASGVLQNCQDGYREM